MATKSLLQAIHDGLAEEMRADERGMGLGEDVGRAGGAVRGAERGATTARLPAIHDGLAEEMRADERVMVLGEDVGRAGGVFRVTQGLQEEFGAARGCDTAAAGRRGGGA